MILLIYFELLSISPTMIDRTAITIDTKSIKRCIYRLFLVSTPQSHKP